MKPQAILKYILENNVSIFVDNVKDLKIAVDFLESMGAHPGDWVANIPNSTKYRYVYITGDIHAAVDKPQFVSKVYNLCELSDIISDANHGNRVVTITSDTKAIVTIDGVSIRGLLIPHGKISEIYEASKKIKHD